MVALLVASAATLAVPFAVRRMIDYGFSEGRVGLIHDYFVAMIGVVAVLALASGVAVLSRDDARRAGRRRPARRLVRASDEARSELLRPGEDRRDRLAPLRRHDAAEGDLRLLRVCRAAQPLPVRRRDRDDGRDQPETLGLCADRDSGDRPAALRGGPRRAPALARRAADARRRHRLRQREPRRGAGHAGVRRRDFRREPVPARCRRRLRGRAQDDQGPRLRHRGGAVPRLLQRRRRALARRARRDRRTA